MRRDAKKQQGPRCGRDDSRVVLTGEGTIQTGVGTSCIVPLQTKNESKSGEANSPPQRQGPGGGSPPPPRGGGGGRRTGRAGGGRRPGGRCGDGRLFLWGA